VNTTPPPPATTNKNNRRRQNRIAAMQYLYAWDIIRPENPAEFTRQFFTTQEHPRAYYTFAEELVHGVLAHHPDIDESIRAYAQNWTFERIAKVDLAILRLATHELLHRPDIPPIVTINEAIELAKTYSAQDSKRFVNGILDRIKNHLNRPHREALNP
jgi:N utilization substance protein B